MVAVSINLTLFVVTSIFSIHGAAAHGYQSSPRSREYLAHTSQEGKWSPAGTSADQFTPAAENCPHCANRQANINGVIGRCGLSSSGYNYDAPLNVLGSSLPPKIQATYVKGQQIDLQVVLTAHHKGHFTYSACALKTGETTATQQCFDANPLTFVQDNLYGAPKDPSYPDRAYIPLTTFPGIQSGGDPYGYKFNHRFALPPSVVGDRVLIQWHYWTANSCIYPGYRTFNWPANYFDQQGLPDCGSIPLDGNGIPEQFWNCAEVTILDAPLAVPPSTPKSPAKAVSPVPKAVPVSSPVKPAQSPPSSSDGDSRLIAYLGNWQSCPSDAQVAKYTHIMVAFAVTYTWAPIKNICDQSCTIGAPVPICNNAPNPGLMAAWKAAGKKVILSFGGAGMGGSWDGDVNNCWDYCFGKESSVITQLTNIVKNQGFDGVDLDYEYFYSTAQQQNFISAVTTGLRAALPAGSIVTHAPMDSDLVAGKAYYEVLRSVSASLSFLMPQYYNGITRPALDGISGTGTGSTSALSHYTNLVNNLFNGDPTKVVFGFCISDCSNTNSNANAQQAVKVMNDLKSYYPCNGGAFFWVAEHDSAGSWSTPVSGAIQPSTGCSISSKPVPKPVLKPVKPAPKPVLKPVKPVPKPVLKPVPIPLPKPVASPLLKPSSSVVGTCGNGVVGNGICPDKSLCCSQWGYCGTGSAYCPAPSKPSPPTVAGTCGNGAVGNGICPDKTLCCSQWGYCGTGSAYCG